MESVCNHPTATSWGLKEARERESQKLETVGLSRAENWPGDVPAHVGPAGKEPRVLCTEQDPVPSSLSLIFH